MPKATHPEPDQEAVLAEILDCDPTLRGLSVVVHRSWDSDAFDFADRWIVKSPRSECAKAALARERRLLTFLQGRVAIPIPQMTWLDEAERFTRHQKIAGDCLTSRHYNALTGDQKNRLATTLAEFYVGLHGILVREAVLAGALPVPDLRAQAAESGIAALPQNLQSDARAALDAYDSFGPDPMGEVCGFFDGHGWNMAFDLAAGRLNGVFDFADSGIGPLHREFVPSSFVAPDLTWRIVDQYEAQSQRSLSRSRIRTLTLVQRLCELGQSLNDAVMLPSMLANVTDWLDNPGI